MKSLRMIRNASFAILVATCMLSPTAVLKADPFGLSCGDWCNHKQSCGAPEALLEVWDCSNSADDFYNAALTFCGNPANIQGYTVYGEHPISYAFVDCWS